MYWTDGAGRLYAGDCQTGDRAATDAEVAAYFVAQAAANPPTLTFLQFMALFTSAEQASIFASNDTQTKMFLIMAAGSGGLQLDNPEVGQGVDYLAATASSTPPGPGLIAPTRVAQILAGTAPGS